MLDEYPYLVATTVLTLLAGGMIAALPRWRRFLLLSGAAVALPCAVVARFHYAGLWRPKVLLGNAFLNGEDLLWSLSAAVIANALAIAPFARRLEPSARPPRPWLTFVALIVVALAAFLVCCTIIRQPTRPAYATLAALAAVAAAALWRRRDLWPVGLAGAVGYTLFHAADAYAFVRLWPQTLAYWTPQGQLPGSFLGIPSFEFAWSVAFGFAWPMVSCCVFNVAWRRPAPVASHAVGVA